MSNNRAMEDRGPGTATGLASAALNTDARGGHGLSRGESGGGRGGGGRGRGRGHGSAKGRSGRLDLRFESRESTTLHGRQSLLSLSSAGGSSAQGSNTSGSGARFDSFTEGGGGGSGYQAKAPAKPKAPTFHGSDAAAALASGSVASFSSNSTNASGAEFSRLNSGGNTPNNLARGRMDGAAQPGGPGPGSWTATAPAPVGEVDAGAMAMLASTGGTLYPADDFD